MGSVLYTCSDLGALADRLAKDLQDAGGDPLVPVHLIVPHPLTDAWLRRRIARALGVAMNLRSSYPARGFWEALAACDPDRPAPGEGPIDRPELELRVAAVLINASPDDPDLEPLLRYCGAMGKADARSWRRLWQLSQRLSEGFLDYEQHLPHMMLAWGQGGLIDQGDPIERAQSEVYRRALLTPDDPALTLGLYAQGALARLRPPSDPRPRLYVFGLSLFSELQLRILKGLAAAADIRVYYSEPPELGDVAEEKGRILSQWGRTASVTGRRLRGRLVSQGGPFESVAVASPGRHPVKTDLHAIHAAVRGCATPAAPQGDGTFRVLSASAVHREAEAIRDDILVLLEKEPGLTLDDIAVLVADPEPYAVPITSAFGASVPPVPHNVLGLAVGGASAYAEGVASLLALAGGNLDRQAAFGLIGNPCFQAAIGLGREEAAAWRSWVEGLAIYHSWDGDLRHERGYGLSDRFTWGQGLRRLRLGQIMEETDEAGGPFAETPPFRDLQAGDREATAAFDEAIEGLLRDLADWSRPDLRRTAAQWAGDLTQILDTYLAVPADRRGEGAVAASVREGLQTLEAHLGDTPVGLTFVSEAITGWLGGLAERVGRPLHGVTIAPLAMPLAIPPFKVIYIAGFNEQAFPGTLARQQLDLRQTRHHGHEDELWPTDHNRHLGREAMLAASSALRIGTLNRDLQKDEEHFPSPMLAQLMRLLGWPDAGGELPSELLVRVPLHASSRECLDPDSPMSTRSVWDQVLGWRWLAERSGGDPGPEVADEETKRLQVRTPNRPATPSRPAVAVLTLRRLAKFLEEPLTEALRRHLRIEEDADEGGEVAHEPLEASPLEAWALHTAPLSEYVRRVAADGRANLREIAQRQYDRRARQGKLPEGVLGKVDADHRRTLLDAAGEGLREFLGGASIQEARYVPRLILGGAPTREVQAERVPPTRLQLGAGASAELRGSIDHWWVGEEEVHALRLTSAGTCKTTLGPKGAAVAVFPRYVLEPFLMASALLASEDEAARDYVRGRSLFVHVLLKDGTVVRYGFGPLDPNAAQGHLASLCEDYLDPTQFDLLPLDAVQGDLSAWAAIATPDTAGCTHEDLVRLIEEAQTSHGGWTMPDQVRLLRDPLGYVPADPRAILMRRIGPICEAQARGGG